MTSTVDNVRIYATELLLVLARTDVNNFSQWGLDLLIGQIYDENKVIANASINILHELSYDQVSFKKKLCPSKLIIIIIIILF